ncbi:flavin-binding monooxygenase family protein [Actinidia rufa]|uniref:Flavin-containing monooxygenase n=1 Tax=Actinidia rufa TaxID=165716 RepID=A0A7J0F1T3_9ERIC|nr:flavin-binding monooxygenase family protein [Actinidia rufa]
MKVAVIGAGATGLIAARELQSEGHRAVVFERKNQLGGTWVYDSRVEADPLSLDPSREVVISSLYFSLRTNLPRHLMGDFGLGELIRFGAEVVRVERVDSGKDQWVVESRTSEVSSEEFFEAVVVCNGHHTEPRVAFLPGIEKWPGRQVHSHNYRHPEPYQNQVVVMIGNGPSAYDISREIATVAKEVHLSSRSPDVKVSRLGNHHNIWQHSKGVPFPLTELQSKWIAGTLSGKLLLPSEEEMLAEVEAHYKQMEENGIPKHHTHFLNPFGDWLSAQVGLPPLDERLKDVFWQLVMCLILQKDGYRDEMDIDSLIRSAT